MDCRCNHRAWYLLSRNEKAQRIGTIIVTIVGVLISTLWQVWLAHLFK